MPGLTRPPGLAKPGLPRSRTAQDGSDWSDHPVAPSVLHNPDLVAIWGRTKNIIKNVGSGTGCLQMARKLQKS